MEEEMNTSCSENMLKVDFNGNRLMCRISSAEKTGLEYAFYLKRDNVRVKTAWYTSNPSREFILEKDGEYSVVGFVRDGENVSVFEEGGILFKSNSINADFDFSEKTVNIFGSCVSRDLLEFGIEKNLALKSYTARSSILSTVSKVLPVREKDVHLASKFQKKQVLKDLSKSFWVELSENVSDYLIIDFIDERFPIGKYKNTYLTLSNEFLESHYLENQYEIVERVKEEENFFVEGKMLTSYLDDFVENLLELYAPGQIILHRAKHVDKYLSKNRSIKKFSKAYLQRNQKLNTMLDYMYDYVEQKLPGCISLDFHGEYYADENHKWGLSTMHYEQDYYIRVLNELSAILKDREGETH